MTRATRMEHIKGISTEYGHVLLDETSGKYWHLNETAARVLLHFQQNRSVEDVVRDFVSSYGISAQRAREDIEAVTAQLRNLGLL